MTRQKITDPKQPIGEILQTVGREGCLLETSDQNAFALFPLDADMIDYLIERNPKFIEECRQIRERMRAGKSRSHDEVKKLLAGD